MHLIDRSISFDGSAATISEPRKTAHYLKPGYVSIHLQSLKLCNLVVEGVGRLEEGSYELADQLATHITGGMDGRSISSKRVIKERLLQVSSIPTCTVSYAEDTPAAITSTWYA